MHLAEGKKLYIATKTTQNYNMTNDRRIIMCNKYKLVE